MSTSGKKSTITGAAAPLKSGKGMSGTGSDEGGAKYGGGGSGDPRPDHGHGPRGGGKKKPSGD